MARSRSRKTSRRTKKSETTLPKQIFATVSPHSIGGVSMFDASYNVLASTAGAFTSEETIMMSAVDRLTQAGFEILQITESTINIAGSPKTYEKAFGAPIEVKQFDAFKSGGVEDKAEFLDCPNCDMFGLIETKGTEFEGLIEGVALDEPYYYMAPNAHPPVVDYWHHQVPAGISLACNADRAHRANITGRGVVVAMVDSGWYRHPFFVERGYRSDNAILGPGASSPLTDEVGHGTGESANIFATAPDVRLKPVKMNLNNAIGAFNAAVGLNPDIITCSWSSSRRSSTLSAGNIALANAVASAVASGITVVFSAGNGGWGFPAQHPDVIAAGGVFMEPDGQLRASDYASGFASAAYPGRNVPDLSGIVGMRPRAMNIMLPVEPNDDIDRGNAGGSHPNGDETPNNDGWAAFSGTSASAPQLAGVAALVKQSCNRLTPAEIKDIMKTTARDVTRGRNHPNMNNAATAGPDLATGHGLVDAHRATLIARLRCRTITPIRPIQPIQPVQPIRPVQPVRPVQPIRPVQPVQPVGPIRPIRPVQPISPVRPVQPVNPIRPVGPVVRPAPPGVPSRMDEEGGGVDYEGQAQDAYQGADLTEEELDTLEDMVKTGQVDPDEL